MRTTIVNNNTEAIDWLVDNIPNTNTERHHINHVPTRINRYPVNIAICADERTGARFGKSECRSNRNPEKIGGGGRNKSSDYAYQIWIWDTNG